MYGNHWVFFDIHKNIKKVDPKSLVFSLTKRRCFLYKNCRVKGFSYEEGDNVKLDRTKLNFKLLPQTGIDSHRLGNRVPLRQTLSNYPIGHIILNLRDPIVTTNVNDTFGPSIRGKFLRRNFVLFFYFFFFRNTFLFYKTWVVPIRPSHYVFTRRMCYYFC